MYVNVGDSKDPLKQDLALEFCRNQIKDFSILTETNIKHNQMRNIRNSCLGPIFTSPGDSDSKELHVLLHPGLEDVIEVALIQNGGLCHLRLLPLMKEFSVFVAPQYITQGTSWLGDISL